MKKSPTYASIQLSHQQQNNKADRGIQWGYVPNSGCCRQLYMRTEKLNPIYIFSDQEEHRTHFFFSEKFARERGLEAET